MDILSQIQKDSKPLLGGQNVELLNQTCALHEQNRFEYLCIDSDQQEYVFKCVYCVTDEDVKQYSLIPLKQIINAHEETIFTNFPFTDRALTKKIKQITQKPTSEALKLQIDHFFKDLTIKILAKLDSIQTNMVQKAQSISNQSEEITSMYNSMSEKENLKQILLDVSKPSAADKSPQIKALCERVLSKETKNQQTIQAAIEKVAILERTIDFDTPNQIKKSVLRLLEQIDMFMIEDIGNFSEILRESKVPVTRPRYAHFDTLTEKQTNEIANLVEQLTRINQQAGNNKDNDDQKYELNADELFELISNQTNFCSNEYLQDLRTIFEDIRGVLKLFHTRKLNARTQEQKSFNRLNQAQLQNIARLAAKVNELTESYGDQYLLSNQPQQFTQSNSTELIKLLNDSRLKNMFVRDFDKLLVNYPIFETLPIFQSIQIERTLPQMKFTRSTLYLSQEMGITYKGNEVHITLDEQGNGQCNSQILDNDRGFSLKLTFNRPFGSAKSGYCRIGLILNSQIPSNWVLYNSSEAGFHSYLNQGASRMIRGNKLTSEGLRNVTSSLEFRWCVAKRQFFYTDSTYQNINQVDEMHFSPTEQYSFAVFFNNLVEHDWKVTISEFKEIDPNKVDKFN